MQRMLGWLEREQASFWQMQIRKRQEAVERARLRRFLPAELAERLGVGPEHVWARNPKLVYGRMTGWGQSGPLAQAAGHDINYIALAGALEPIGRAGQAPLPPLNLVGDFGGGGMLLAFGVACALLEARSSGRGSSQGSPCFIQSSGTAPAGPGAGCSSGWLRGGASSGPWK